MYSASWIIDYAFDYPVDCTPAKLLERLEYFSADWPGWPNFPWRVTRSIHKFLDHPPANFHYLTIHRCLQGFAAHLVLNSRFENRDEVLAAMIREKCEIVGLLRLLLIDAVRYELRFTKMDYIRDCSGPEDRQEPVPPEELEKRRTAFRETIEGAVKEFVRILNLMSVTKDMNARILGRPLRYWARGGDMPEAVTLPVQVEVTADGKVLKPCQAEMEMYARGGFLSPGVLVERVKKVSGVRRQGSGVRGETSTARDVKGREGGEMGNVQHSTSNIQRPSGDGERAKARKVVAGFGRAAVRNIGDRKDIRVEVQRLMKMGIPQTEACRQVADNAKNGRAGQRRLTMKYDMSPNVATGSVVRRVLVSDW